MSVVATKHNDNKWYVVIVYHNNTLTVLYRHIFEIFEKLFLLKKFGDVGSTTFRPLPRICIVVQHS